MGLTVLLLAVCAGCIVIPTDYYRRSSRKNVSKETQRLIIPGQTTKEDVFLALGEPDEVSRHGSWIAYQWTKVKGFWLIIIPAGPPIQMERDYSVIITFDDHGLVLKREFHSTVRGRL